MPDTNVTPEAIVFIAGFGSTEQDYFRDRLLIAGLLHYAASENINIRFEEDVYSGKFEGRRLVATFPDSGAKTLDAYEAFWGDLIGSLSSKPQPQRWLEANPLMSFWRRTPLGTDRRLKVGFVGFGALLLAWYLSTFLAVLCVLLQKPADLGLAKPLITSAKLGGAALLAHAPAGLALALHAVALAVVTLANGLVWALLGALLVLLRVGAVVDASDFTRRYLEDCLAPGGGPLQRKIRKRLLEVLSAVSASGRYGRITVVAHSMGVLVATDLLANAPVAAPPLRYFSLGGSLRFLALRAPVVKDYACAYLAHVTAWTDFYAPSDLLASDAPVLRPEDSPQVSGRFAGPESLPAQPDHRENAQGVFLRRRRQRVPSVGHASPAACGGAVRPRASRPSSSSVATA